MATFSVSIDLAEHEYRAAGWPAQHRFVCGLLDDVKQQIGSSPARCGDIVFTGSKDGVTYKTKIGLWEFLDGDDAHRSA